MKSSKDDDDATRTTYTFLRFIYVLNMQLPRGEREIEMKKIEYKRTVFKFNLSKAFDIW